MAVLVDVAFRVNVSLLVVPVGSWLRVTRIEVLLRAREVLVTQARRVVCGHMVLLYRYSGLIRTVEVQLALQLLFLGRSSLFLVLPLWLFNFGHFGKIYIKLSDFQYI